jgi:photosystem II stability/assembly factor-like uncharacterized protein
MSPKTIFLLIVLALSISSGRISSQEYWIPTNTPTAQLLRRLYFTDSQTGWAAGDRGTIIHTTDGGDTWQTQSSGFETGIVDIFFLNNSTGWALVWSVSNPTGTIILKTKDGGGSWIPEDYPESDKYMKKVFFIDSLRGWLGGSPDAFVYTIDGGEEWTDIVLDSGGLGHFPVINLSFFDSNYGFANGGIFDIAGVIWKTTNGGVNWYSMGVGPEPIQQIVFFDSLNALGVGGDFEFGTGIARTYDAGENWQYTSLGVAGVATAVSFRTAAEGWACLGSAQKFIFTSDSGNTWTENPAPNHSKIFDLVFADSMHGYAVGDVGVILKYDTTVVSVNSPEPLYPRASIKLYPNYPNPFNPTTNIKFDIPVSMSGAIVELNIYDLNGRLVRTLLKDSKPQGEYSVKWNGFDNTDRAVASGVYICRLTAGAYSQVRKMILLR